MSIVDFSLGFSVYEALRFNFESFVISRLFSGSRILLILRKLDFEGFAAACCTYDILYPLNTFVLDPVIIKDLFFCSAKTTTFFFGGGISTVGMPMFCFTFGFVRD